MKKKFTYFIILFSRLKTDEMTEPKEAYEANAYKIMDMLGPDEVKTLILVSHILQNGIGKKYLLAF